MTTAYVIDIDNNIDKYPRGIKRKYQTAFSV